MQYIGGVDVHTLQSVSILFNLTAQAKMKAAKAIQILGNILLILVEFFQAGKNMFADNAKSSLFLPIQN